MSYLEQIAEPVRIQAFVSKSAVEAFDVAVLHGLAWLNVIGRDLPVDTPGHETARSEFRAIIHADRSGTAAALDNTIENASDSLARKRAIGFQRQTLPCEVIDDREHAYRASACQTIAHEIQRPLCVGRCQNGPTHTDANQFLAPVPFYTQTRLAIYPEQSLVIHGCSLSSKQDPEPTIAEPRPLVS